MRSDDSDPFDDGFGCRIVLYQPINMVYNEVNKGEQHAICSHAALGPLPMKNEDSDPWNDGIGG